MPSENVFLFLFVFALPQREYLYTQVQVRMIVVKYTQVQVRMVVVKADLSFHMSSNAVSSCRRVAWLSAGAYSLRGEEGRDVSLTAGGWAVSVAWLLASRPQELSCRLRGVR